MKMYKDKHWVLDRLISGARNKDLAKECNVSEFTISRHVSSLLDSLSVEEIVGLVNNTSNPKQLISPKTQAYKKIVECTTFLPETAQLRERIWYISNNTKEPPTCKECSNHVKWDYTKQQFRTFCSAKCEGQNKEVQQKREQTTLKNHGVLYPATNSTINRKMKNTMLKRYGVEHRNQKHMDKKSIDLLNDKEFMQKSITEMSTFEIGELLNVSQSVVSKYLRWHDIISPRRSGSRHEREIIDFITALIPEEEIILQTRQLIPPQEIDIYIPTLKLAFEFNGTFWHSENMGRGKYYHIEKTKQCNEKNIRLIHIFENLWIKNKQLIKSRIQNLIQLNPTSIYARKCKIVENIPPYVANVFFQENHIQGFAPASYYVGLEYNGQLVSLMSFGKARYSKKFQYELIRFCSLQQHNVVGGASKLFKHFVKKHQPQSVITYSDKTWNTGNVYEKMGFTYSHTTRPNYYYFKEGEQVVRSRVKFQKHKLKNILRDYDSNLTEWENMRNNGYNRIWDCGNDVFIWNNSV